MDKDLSACEHVTLCCCNVGLLHDDRRSLCLCNMLWCTVVSCHSECCSDDIFLFYTEVSGEYAAYVVTMESSTWMLKIKTANSFENCWIDGGAEKSVEKKGGEEKFGEEKGAEHYVFSVYVFTLPWKQRLNYPRNIRCQLTGKACNYPAEFLLLYESVLKQIAIISLNIVEFWAFVCSHSRLSDTGSEVLNICRYTSDGRPLTGTDVDSCGRYIHNGILHCLWVQSVCVQSKSFRLKVNIRKCYYCIFVSSLVLFIH